MLLQELFTEELSEDAYHGKATVDPVMLWSRVSRGEYSISIYDDAYNEIFSLEYDIDQTTLQHVKSMPMRRERGKMVTNCEEL
jgi:hypothetical protein